MKKLLSIIVLGLILTFKANADERIKLICEDGELIFNLNTSQMLFPNSSSDKDYEFYYNDDYFFWTLDWRFLDNEFANFSRQKISRLTGAYSQDLYKLNDQQLTDWESEWLDFLEKYQLKNVEQTGKLDLRKNIFTYAKYHGFDNFKIVSSHKMECKKSKNIF